MKRKHIFAHIRAAWSYAEVSYCNRLKVGAMVVKDNTPIAIGYNGTPKGEENVCELEDGTTKPSVIHAEDNALRKLIRSHESSINSSVFITHSPCVGCAEKLKDAQVESVFFNIPYRDNKGVELLAKSGICVYHVNLEEETIKQYLSKSGQYITSTLYK